MQKYLITLTFFVLCLSLSGCGQPLVQQQPSLSAQALITKFKAKFATSQHTKHLMQKISVKYLDYQGREQTGEVEVIDGHQRQVQLFFTTLHRANFHISNVKPLGSFGNDVNQALRANATFTIVQDNALVIFLNPITNPVVLKAPAANGNNYNVVIVPRQGLFSVNHTREGQPNGATTPAIIAALQEIGVEQILIQDNGNTLYYGLFKFNTAKTHTKNTHHSTAKRALIKSASPLNGFSFGPLPSAVRQYLIDHKLWNSQCPVSLDRLSYLTLKYYDYNGAVQNGSMVIADVAAEDTLAIFKTLYLSNFPLETVRYNIQDSDSNGGTMAFICRAITGGQKYSLHAYGTAIDISWYRNPYIGLYQLPAGQPYALASLIPPSSPLEFLYRDQPVKDRNEQLHALVQKAGFHQWGGDWHNPTDYMHFDTGQFTSDMIANTDFNTGQMFYRLGANYPDRINKLTDSGSWLKLYQLHQDSFADAIRLNSGLLATMSEYQFFDYVNAYLQSARAIDVSTQKRATSQANHHV